MWTQAKSKFFFRLKMRSLESPSSRLCPPFSLFLEMWPMKIYEEDLRFGRRGRRRDAIDFRFPKFGTRSRGAENNFWFLLDFWGGRIKVYLLRPMFYPLSENFVFLVPLNIWIHFAGEKRRFGNSTPWR